MRYILLAFCLFLAVRDSAVAQETRIAAVVNDDVVSLGDLAARLLLAIRTSGLEDTAQTRQRFAPRMLRRLIDEKLELQEAKRLNIAVTQEEINDAIGRIEAQSNMKKGDLERFLEKNGIPRSTLTDQITADLAWNKLIQKRLTEQITISDDEVSEALAKVKEEANTARSRVAEIFLAVDNPSQEEEVRRFADGLVEKIRTGNATFPALARQFSQSPTAAAGGDLGWVTPAQLPPALSSAIQKMKQGEMSYPIRSGGGYYMLLLIGQTTGGSPDVGETTLSLSEVVFPLAASATQEERQRATAEAKEISTTAKSCGEIAQIVRERSPRVRGDTGQIKAKELPPELRKTVLDLKIAEASPPVTVPGGIGVIMVCQRQDPADKIPSRDEMTNILARQRLDALARRYLRDLQRTAFVDERE